MYRRWDRIEMSGTVENDHKRVRLRKQDLGVGLLRWWPSKR